MGLIKASLMLNLPRKMMQLKKRKRFFGVFALLIFFTLFLFTDSSPKTYFLRPVVDGLKGIRPNYSFQFPPSVSPALTPSIDTNPSVDEGFEAGKQRKEMGRSISNENHESIASQNHKILQNYGAKLRNLSGIEGKSAKNGAILSSNTNGTVLGMSQLGTLGLAFKNVSFLMKSNSEEAPATYPRGDQTPVNGTEGREIDQREVKVSGYDTDQSCDYFDGKWVRDNTRPYYPPGSCPFVDKSFDCYGNGRPDKGYLKWRWQPHGCNLPSFDGRDFLKRLRGKRLVFVGDSLNRNMWESLVCILRHSIRNKASVYEISGRSDFKKKGCYAIRFEEYNCSIDFVFSPFLVRASLFRGRNGMFETLRLDTMDRSPTYNDAAIIVFNTGHWWTHEKTSKGKNYYQVGNYVYPQLEALEAYKKALTTWSRWVDRHINPKRTLVFFRGYSATHFRGGQWNSGGQCDKETEPIFNDSYLESYPQKMKALEDVLRQMKTSVIYLNVTRLTDYRKDGHPSIYRTLLKTAEQRQAAEQTQDCSHWCLPGIPDAWNDLLYAYLLKHLKPR